MAATFGNAFSFGKKVLQVREPTEFAQAQSYFLSSQAQALSDHAKELGRVFEEANQTVKTSMQEARETARRREAA
jgi:Phasin protein